MSREPWPQYAKANSEGPWGNPLSVVGGEDGMPRSANSILELARIHGWGFGPITLVARMNYDDPNIPPFFMRWDYNIETGKWSFTMAMAQNGQKLTVRDARTVIEHPDALLPEDPNA